MGGSFLTPRLLTPGQICSDIHCHRFLDIERPKIDFWRKDIWRLNDLGPLTPETIDALDTWRTDTWRPISFLDTWRLYPRGLDTWRPRHLTPGHLTPHSFLDTWRPNHFWTPDAQTCDAQTHDAQSTFWTPDAWTYDALPILDMWRPRQILDTWRPDIWRPKKFGHLTPRHLMPGHVTSYTVHWVSFKWNWNYFLQDLYSKLKMQNNFRLSASSSTM